MRLYLVQHGDSVEKDVDPERPLSEKGRKDVYALSNFISQMNIGVSKIHHSGKLRAEQTAKILAEGVHCQTPPSVLSGIEPMDSVAPIAYEIESWEEDALLAGHLPFMAKLVAKLTTGDENTIVASYQPGSMVCLEKVKEKHWLICWMLRPELLQGI